MIDASDALPNIKLQLIRNLPPLYIECPPEYNINKEGGGGAPPIIPISIPTSPYRRPPSCLPPLGSRFESISPEPRGAQRSGVAGRTATQQRISCQATAAMWGQPGTVLPDPPKSTTRSGPREPRGPVAPSFDQRCEVLVSLLHSFETSTSQAPTWMAEQPRNRGCCGKGGEGCQHVSIVRTRLSDQ